MPSAPSPVSSSRVAELNRRLEPFFAEAGKILVGQKTLFERLLLGLVTGGHLLLEGVPGLAKTLAVKTLAGTLRLRFRRIQFTPDLLPADVIGTQVYQPRTGDFTIKKGPVFANLVLADEVNRAPAKVQSALLEAMQERQVTIGEETFPLPDPFLVLATQNPIEQEGTYPLPEAQVDRFMMKLKLGYPAEEEELEIVQRMAHLRQPPEPAPVLEESLLADLRTAVEQLYLDEKVQRYIVSLARATRPTPGQGGGVGRLVQFGVSPRGTLALALAAKGLAFLRGRNFVTPDDVKEIAPDVLRHRLLLTYEAEAEDRTPDQVLQEILAGVEVP